MINYNKVGRFANIKYSIIQFYNRNKLKVFVVGFIIVLTLLTGVFTAIKISDLEKAIKSVEFGFEALSNGDIYELSFFFQRYLSILLVMALLFVFSLTKFTCIFGYMLIGYRSFLLALNCSLIIRYMGLGGVINSIIIILPCQLCQLLLMSLFLVISCQLFKDKKECGKISQIQLKLLLTILAVSFLVNIIELLLLLTFKATTILII